MSHSKYVLVGAAWALLAAPVWAENAVQTTVDDATLNTKVNSALVSDPVTKARQIDVEVSKGVVQLNGFVDSEAAKERAEDVAEGVAGVTDVRNNLEVATADRKTGEVIDDGVITTKVKAALIADGDTKAYQINVTTRQGVVQLSGFVSSSTAKTEAARLAREVGGVREVKNELEVRS